MKLRITVDGKTYDVEVEVTEDSPEPHRVVHNYVPPAHAALTPPPPAPGSAPPGVANDKVCRSPIVGTVVRVNVQPGQQIQVNDPMLVLEAMKMETNITSPVAAKVKAVPVNLGDSVQSGQVLVEFE